MYVPFNSLPDTSRLWVYQADKPFDNEQKAIIKEVLTVFTTNWEVHGKPMRGSYDILDNYFVILAADESFNSASGCSIDDSVRVIRALGERLSVDFFNRNNVFFRLSDDVAIVPLAEVKKRIELKSLDENSLFFNTLIKVKSDLTDQWLIPISVSWLKRYLPQEKVSH
jgi:hypothetical protein